MGLLLWGGIAQAQTQRDVLFDLFTRVQQLEQEVRRLRGEVEQLRYERQREERVVIEEVPSAIELPPPPASGTLPPMPTTAAPLVVELATAREELDAGRQALRDNQTQVAVTQLRMFVDRYPQHRDRGEALYWLGEAHYVRREFEEAEKVLIEVRDQHSQAPEMPLALLRLGNIYEALEQKAAAEQAYRQLVEQFGETPAGQRAEQRLKRLGE